MYYCAILLFHHISSCVEPSLMFCRVAESWVAGNDKTDHRYPAHLLPELNRQNNLIQNHLHPPHYLYWRQNFSFSFYQFILKAVEDTNIYIFSFA